MVVSTKSSSHPSSRPSFKPSLPHSRPSPCCVRFQNTKWSKNYSKFLFFNWKVYSESNYFTLKIWNNPLEFSNSVNMNCKHKFHRPLLLFPSFFFPLFFLSLLFFFFFSSLFSFFFLPHSPLFFIHLPLHPPPSLLHLPPHLPPSLLHLPPHPPHFSHLTITHQFYFEIVIRGSTNHFEHQAVWSLSNDPERQLVGRGVRPANERIGEDHVRAFGHVYLRSFC